MEGRNETLQNISPFIMAVHLKESLRSAGIATNYQHLRSLSTDEKQLVS